VRSRFPALDSHCFLLPAASATQIHPPLQIHDGGYFAVGSRIERDHGAWFASRHWDVWPTNDESRLGGACVIGRRRLRHEDSFHRPTREIPAAECAEKRREES